MPCALKGVETSITEGATGQPRQIKNTRVSTRAQPHFSLQIPAFPQFFHFFFKSIFPILAPAHGAVDIAEGALSMRSKHLANTAQAPHSSAPRKGSAASDACNAIRDRKPVNEFADAGSSQEYYATTN
jgi:hypothetical protein